MSDTTCLDITLRVEVAASDAGGALLRRGANEAEVAAFVHALADRILAGWQATDTRPDGPALVAAEVIGWTRTDDTSPA